jgi:hypothetical protein
MDQLIISLISFYSWILRLMSASKFFPLLVHTLHFTLTHFIFFTVLTNCDDNQTIASNCLSTYLLALIVKKIIKYILILFNLLFK